MMYECICCGGLFPKEKMRKDSRRVANGGVANVCKPCHNETNKKGRKTPKWQDTVRAYKQTPEYKVSRYKSDFKLTQEEAEYWVLEADKCCAICDMSDEAHKEQYGFSLHLDHCHETGAIRGWLCRHHNIALSKHITPEELRLMADYLEGIYRPNRYE